MSVCTNLSLHASVPTNFKKEQGNVNPGHIPAAFAGILGFLVLAGKLQKHRIHSNMQFNYVCAFCLIR